MTFVWVLLLLLALVAAPFAWPRLRTFLGWRRHCLQLAKRHGLSTEHAALLWRLARRTAPTLPLRVFVQPSLLARAEAELGADPADVAAIQARLFGG